MEAAPPHDRDHAGPIEVGAILEALRADVRARRLAQGYAAPSQLERDLQRSLDEIELTRVISAHWPLIGRTVPERVMVLVNKLVRRYLRWYINPIVEQQNAYNDAVARAIRLLAEAYAGLVGHQPPGNGQVGDEGRWPVVDQHPIPDTQHLQTLVQERGAAEPPAHFPELGLRALEPLLRERQAVSAHWPLAGKTLPQRLVALANKLIRRYLRWYINPIVEQQSAANAAFTAALLNLVRIDAGRRAQMARQRAERRVTSDG